MLSAKNFHVSKFRQNAAVQHSKPDLGAIFALS